jgi:hypothetical protein
MAARATSFGSAQCSSYPSYSESPSRNVQLQSEVKTSGRKSLRPAAPDDVSRRNTCSSLRSSIYNALGSSEPVSLLPHLSSRTSLTSYKNMTDTSLDKNSRLSTIESAIPETTSVVSAQPPTQEKQRSFSQPRASPSVLEEVLYATPPGCRPEGKDWTVVV